MVYKPVFIVFFFATVLLLTLLVSRISNRCSTALAFQHQANVLSTEPYLNQKLAHAEKLWEKSIQGRKEMVRQSGHDRKFPDGYINPFNVWEFARPSFNCPHDLERVGQLGDGGKIVCGMSRYEKECPGPSSKTNPARELIVYSFGVDDDSSFEAELLHRTNARIWGYDMSVNSWAEQIPEYQYPRASFEKVAIGKETDMKASPPIITIQDLMKMNGHSYIDLLKMDIEGAEFDSLTSLIESVIKDGNSTLPFGQLLIEIHIMKDPPGFKIPTNLETWLKWWSSLEAMGLRPVNSEDNWIGDRVYAAPRFMEVRYNIQSAFPSCLLTIRSTL